MVKHCLQDWGIKDNNPTAACSVQEDAPERHTNLSQSSWSTGESSPLSVFYSTDVVGSEIQMVYIFLWWKSRMFCAEVSICTWCFSTLLLLLWVSIPIIKFFPFDTFLYNRSNTFGALVGPEKYSGSSMLQYHPRWFPSSYEIYDENFRDACCGAADLCQVFYSRRPPDDCSRYRPPRWSKKSYS